MENNVRGRRFTLVQYEAGQALSTKEARRQIEDAIETTVRNHQQRIDEIIREAADKIEAAFREFDQKSAAED